MKKIALFILVVSCSRLMAMENDVILYPLELQKQQQQNDGLIKIRNILYKVYDGRLSQKGGLEAIAKEDLEIGLFMIDRLIQSNELPPKEQIDSGTKQQIVDILQWIKSELTTVPTNIVEQIYKSENRLTQKALLRFGFLLGYIWLNATVVLFFK